MKVYFMEKDNTVKPEQYNVDVEEFCFFAYATNSMELLKSTGRFGIREANPVKARQEAQEILNRGRYVSSSEISRLLHDIVNRNLPFEIESLDDAFHETVIERSNNAVIPSSRQHIGKQVYVRIIEKHE